MLQPHCSYVSSKWIMKLQHSRTRIILSIRARVHNFAFHKTSCAENCVSTKQILCFRPTPPPLSAPNTMWSSLYPGKLLFRYLISRHNGEFEHQKVTVLTAGTPQIEWKSPFDKLSVRLCTPHEPTKTILYILNQYFRPHKSPEHKKNIQ